MNKYIIEYSKDSKQDLIEIKSYIKYNLQEPDIADRLITKIQNEIDELAKKPEIYPFIDDDFIKKLELRKIIVDNYVVVYRVKNNSLEIVRVLYGKRNWIRLL